MLTRLRLVFLAAALVSSSACFTYFDASGAEWACDGTGYHDLQCTPTGKHLRDYTPCFPVNGKGC